MRPGLVVIGTLLLVLAVAAVSVVMLTPPGTHETRNVWTVPTAELLAGATNFALLPGDNTSDAELSVSWSGTVPTEVRLFEVPGCAAPSLSCARGTPAHAWSAALSGNWSERGSLVFPFLVVWNTSAPTAGTWGLTAVESISTPVSTGLWSTLVIDAASAALGVVGAVAVFLGLFLRGGAYRGPAPMVSRSAEDVHEIAGPPRPPR